MGLMGLIGLIRLIRPIRPISPQGGCYGLMKKRVKVGRFEDMGLRSIRYGSYSSKIWVLWA